MPSRFALPACINGSPRVLAAHYHLPLAQVREVVNEQLQRAMRRHALPWACLLGGWSTAQLLYLATRDGAVLVAWLAAAGALWWGVARRLAEPGIRQALQALADRRGVLGQ